MSSEVCQGWFGRRKLSSSHGKISLARRTRRNRKVQAAVRALAALRSADADYDLAAVQRLLEGMLDVSAVEFLVRNADGAVVGMRDMELLSPAERARLKKLEAPSR